MKHGRRYASSTEVARLAGVSQSAVSRTFTPGASVSPTTRAKVVAAAEALGFQPSLIPQIMRTERSGIVGIAVGGLENPFYGQVLQELTARLQNSGRQSLLVPVDSDYALDAAVTRLSQYRVDAIVSALAVLSPEAAALLSNAPAPLIAFNSPVAGPRVSTIGSDNRKGGRMAAELLARRGARRLAFVSGPPDSPAAQDRQTGFHEGAIGAGLPAPLLLQGAYTYAGGVSAAGDMPEGRASPEGVFCVNDLAAFGLIDTLRRARGLRVPEDLLVLGYDATPPAAWGAYDLTSLDQDIPAMAAAAMAMLDAIDGAGGWTSQAVLVPPRMVERGSTGAAGSEAA